MKNEKSHENLFGKCPCSNWYLGNVFRDLSISIKSICRFSRRITPQLQNWLFLTYLHGKPRNTYIYPTQECQNVSNTSRRQEVVVSLLNLPYYGHFSCLKNCKCSFWKIMIFAVVTLFFWRSDVGNVHSGTCIREFDQKSFKAVQKKRKFFEPDNCYW